MKLSTGKYLIIIVSISLLVSCKSKESEPMKTNAQSILIEGTLEEGANTLVILHRMGPSFLTPIDSARCREDGSFSIQFDAPTWDYYALKYTEQGYVTLILQPGEEVKLTGNAERLQPYHVTGSSDSRIIADLSARHKLVLDELQDISERSAQLLGDNDFSAKKALLNSHFDSVTSSFHKYSLDFINKNEGSPATLVALYNQYGPGLPVFHPVDDFQVYVHTDSVLYANHPNNPAINSLHSEVYATMEQLRNNAKLRTLTIGDKAPDFVLPDQNGHPFALSEYKGKYVLLHFWASWSMPSYEENAHLLNAHSAFKAKNFEIIQISIDFNKEAWLKAIEPSKEKWNHLSELQHWDSKIVDLYQVERIPANFLIAPNGEIVERDIFGDELLKKLSTHLH